MIAGIYLQIAVCGSLMRPITLEEDFNDEFLTKYRIDAQDDKDNNNIPLKKTYMLYESTENARLFYMIFFQDWSCALIITDGHAAVLSLIWS